MTSYTKVTIKDFMLAGVGDDDIRRKLLSTEDTLSRASYEIIVLIKSKEMNHHATESPRAAESEISSFQSQPQRKE